MLGRKKNDEGNDQIDARGSYRLIYSKLEARDRSLVVAALILAVCSGVLPSLTAQVVGAAFDAFTAYNLALGSLSSTDLLQQAKHAFMSAVLRSVWQLCSLAVGTLLLSTLTIGVWIVVGERVAHGWRTFVYDQMSERDMTWFDAQLPLNVSDEDDEDEDEKSKDTQDSKKRPLNGVGAGGLMAKFARETDAVRIASAQTAGEMVQSFATIIAALVVAFRSCWSLAFIVLSITPLMLVTIHFLQRRAIKWHLIDMDQMARAGKVLEQSIQAIATIKALTIEERQSSAFMQHIRKTVVAWNKLGVIYGLQFGLMAGSGLLMFAGGFWYGSYLVQAGKATTGDVFTTFWSCVIVSGHISPMVQKRAVLETGKVSAASLHKITQLGERKKKRESAKSLLTVNSTAPAFSSPFEDSKTAFTPVLLNEDRKEGHNTLSPSADDPLTPGSTVYDSPKHRLMFGLDETRSPTSMRLQPMRRIWPNASCQGEVELQRVSFTYPSRPDDAVLRDVSLFLPAGEFTFIVGQSGSGKSTIAHLLLGLYDDYAGRILLDDQDLSFVDPTWTRAHVAGIDQSPIIFDMSIHDNVALGLCGKVGEEGSGRTAKSNANHVPDISRARVKQACKMALLDQDVQKMPNGYDTRLGSGGVDLSGGQKQRLALARAIVRDPTVLILDEATSALDITNRTLVMALIRQWRKGKTTIVITHDFSQIQREDFLYLLERGRLVEQGYRMDLEQKADGHFVRARMATQLQSKGEASEASHKDVTDLPSPTGVDWKAKNALKRFSGMADGVAQQQQRQHVRASRWALNPGLTDIWSAIDNEVEQEKLAGMGTHVDGESEVMQATPEQVRRPIVSEQQEGYRFGRPAHQRAVSSTSSVNSTTTLTTSNAASSQQHQHKSSSGGLRPLRLAQEQQIRTMREHGTDVSLALTSVAVSQRRPDQSLRKAWTSDELEEYTARWAKSLEDEDDGKGEQEMVQKSSRPSYFSWKRWHQHDEGRIVEEAQVDEGDESSTRKAKAETLTKLVGIALGVVWKRHPRKWVLIAGLLATLATSGVQPCFSYVLGRLLNTMGTSASTSVLPFSLGVMALALADAVGQATRFMLLQFAANIWIENVRRCAISNVFAQDKTWFDKEENSSAMLLIRLVKDPEDAKSLISRIIGEVLIVVANMLIVFTWALAQSWQLTLAGIALLPIFYLAIDIQGRVILFYEKQNKLQRERVSKQFYTMIHHAREIRSMGLQSVFLKTYHDSVRHTQKNGIRAAPFVGLGDGIRDGCIFFAQAFMYYIGALLILDDKMTLEQMFIVSNLILFGVSFAANVISYLPSLTKSLQATKDMQAILQLDPRSASDHSGYASPHIQGAVSFRNVSFAYPGRPDKLVLDGCSFDVAAGERVALVGASGCGKSTVAALLQRLYEPSQPGGGVIVLDDRWPLHSIFRHHLRSQLACVSQRSDLFDDSIRANIQLGQPAVTEHRLWQALQLTCCDSFIEQLDAGLDTTTGENANNISGGQKQRLAIARAVVREQARIRILDECTSALDPHNQEAVASNLFGEHKEHVSWFNAHLTTIIVTHKIELMRRCDRIIVLENGKVVQQGPYEKLIAEKGKAFSKLANAGEWGA